MDLGGVGRRHGVQQAAELPGQRLAEGARARGDDLAELDVGGAEVGEEQKALRQVGGEHLGDMHPGGLEQLLDLQPGLDILVAGRRIHHHAGAAVGETDAEVAAKTGVGGGRGEVHRLARKQGRQPGVNILLS